MPQKKLIKICDWWKLPDVMFEHFLANHRNGPIHNEFYYIIHKSYFGKFDSVAEFRKYNETNYKF